MAKATATKIRTGKKNRGAVYVKTKSGGIYRFNTVFTTPAATRTFIAKVKASKGRIDTRHWTKIERPAAKVAAVETSKLSHQAVVDMVNRTFGLGFALKGRR